MQTKKANNWAILLALIATLSFTWTNCGGKNPLESTPMPDVTITTPENNATLTEGPVTIRAEVAKDDTAVQEVAFFIDGQEIGKDNLAPFTQEWTILYWAKDNTHIILAAATYNDGTSGLSDSVWVTVSKSAMRSSGLISPDDNALFLNTDPSPVSLSWNSLRDAAQYNVEISSNPEFSDIEFSLTTRDTNATATNSVTKLGNDGVKTAEKLKESSSEAEAQIAHKIEVVDCFDCAVGINSDLTEKTPTGFLQKSIRHDLPYGKHYWRVRAQNELGLSSAWSETRQFDTVDLNSVINGQGIPGAAEYIPGSGLHSIVVFGDIDPTAISEDWRADSLGVLQLVAYGERGSTLIQTCRYTPFGTIKRYRLTFKVVIYAAKSAEIIESKTFRGGSPRSCPFTARFYPGEVKRYYGSSVPIQTVIDWLAGFVNQ